MMRKHTLFVLLVCLGILGSCCGCFAPDYYLSVEDLTLRSGETKPLSISTNDEIVGITSANLGIATVTSDGKVTGKLSSNTTITVRTKSGLTETCTVTVEKIHCSANSLFSKKPTVTCSFHNDNILYSYYELTWEQVYSGSKKLDAVFFQIKGYDKNGQEVPLARKSASDWLPIDTSNFTICAENISKGDTIRLHQKIYVSDTLAKLTFPQITLEFADETYGECTDYNYFYNFML